jgi:transposase-like protein
VVAYEKRALPQTAYCSSEKECFMGRIKYDKEFKLEAVRLVLEGGGAMLDTHQLCVTVEVWDSLHGEHEKTKEYFRIRISFLR